MKENLGLLLLRLVSGLTMLMSHGWPKLMDFTVKKDVFPDPLGISSPVSLALAVFAEVVCSLLLAAGFFTRWVAIPLVITMAVAFFIVHSADPFGNKELAWVYIAMFGTLALTGPGGWSVDALLRRKKD
ncbi:MAG: transmembrane DoxX protein [Bdellovibrio sp. CG12_big_fil_rev_8_21_14_0_65_39_13]|nr:MAG: transmembrane DoxX protein [Bdellovibrio sp. CG22_combo_CG10-13_8_21_14_all_39_27]PIQ58405.1 MAG: transmembrane DoxX protein [Bdellovibrio sp. CG12_big_fil_rev_8_21_14_0_65_39_13]PIR35918.1 MAG: transmembrane DoxX protein [Bdellovibrio sp. CG11_big_fil_rev_8_21_14_0_20_39_38]